MTLRLTPNTVPEFIRGVILHLFDHGWNGDAETMLEYNTNEKIDGIFKLALEAKDAKDAAAEMEKYIQTQDWDDEADFRCDDYGLPSFGLALIQMLRKYSLIDEGARIYTVSTKKIVETYYDIQCPSCGRRYKERDITKPFGCYGGCGAVINVEEMDA